jgi:(hydroxyamino)benzene mutase
MDTSSSAPRRGHSLLRAGVLLFLLALLVGLAVPHFAVPRLGLSAHLLGITQGLFLMVAGLLWPRLELTRGTSRVGTWLAIYGCFAAWAANVLAALVGAGHAMLPMAAGAAHGTFLEETLIAFGLRTAAVSLIMATAVMLWGLRVYSAAKQET